MVLHPGDGLLAVSASAEDHHVVEDARDRDQLFAHDGPVVDHHPERRFPSSVMLDRNGE
ncbi:MAG: hypothetical protein M0Z87_09190 [Actinomycetota bacterium]|nr:hypothetical protein [Actinomycetota bacterium]